MAAVTGEAARFLVCGGFAAFVNWAARIGLSTVMPFEPAVALAYGIGMVVGFVLYRTVVWRGRKTSLADQIIGFISVNAVSAIVVFAVSVGTRWLLERLLGAGWIVDAGAHGFAIAVGAVANFIGHRTVTFRVRAGA